MFYWCKNEKLTASVTLRVNGVGSFEARSLPN
jgi:hypothetical protein